jgi:hypothetical protein
VALVRKTSDVSGLDRQMREIKKVFRTEYPTSRQVDLKPFRLKSQIVVVP